MDAITLSICYDIPILNILTYNLLNSLKTVVIANKYIRKGGNDENKKRS